MELIGVIGAGVMGTGVAQSLAQKKYSVILIDTSDEILEKSKEQMIRNIRFHGLYQKADSIENADEIVRRIHFTKDYAQLNQIDFVIENVSEKLEIKKEVYYKLEEVCPQHSIFAVNTSCISITKIASLTKRPSKVIGTHFMNPVPMIKTVETIRGYHTSEETIEKTRQILGTLGKECILVNDYPGFVSNRLSHLLMNEAAFVVQDQVAVPEDVDEIFKKCYGHKMGPLETADLIGLDTVVDSLNVLYHDLQDPKFRCCPLLQKMVHAGLLGRKSRKGFYEYY